MKKFMFAGLGLLFAGQAFGAMPFTGFYQTIDDKTNNPKSIVRLYECKEIGDNDPALCGRIIALYDAEGKTITETLNKPERIADKVKGSPKMAGLDIIWNMEWDADDNEYEDGKIMDPKSGSVYSSVIWADKKDANILHVRGKIGPFGRTQDWNVFPADQLPKDIQNLDTSKWEVKVIK